MPWFSGEAFLGTFGEQCVYLLAVQLRLRFASLLLPLLLPVLLLLETDFELTGRGQTERHAELGSIFFACEDLIGRLERAATHRCASSSRPGAHRGGRLASESVIFSMCTASGH